MSKKKSNNTVKLLVFSIAAIAIVALLSVTLSSEDISGRLKLRDVNTLQSGVEYNIEEVPCPVECPPLPEDYNNYIKK